MSVIDKILVEAKQRGVLYHFTSISNAYRIIEKNILRGGDLVNNLSGDDLKSIYKNRSGVSLTRDKIFHKTADRKFDAVTSVSVRISLDGNKLSTKYKIVPFNFWIDRNTRPKNTESEELVLVTKGISPIIPYILKIDILDSVSHSQLNDLIDICENNNIDINIPKLSNE